MGLSVTRRSLNLLCKRFNDEIVKCLTCFVCAQLRTTCESYPTVNLECQEETSGKRTREIEFISTAWLENLEASHPGTLFDNCSFELWHKRYVTDQPQDRRCPWRNTGIIQQPWSHVNAKDKERHISKWATRFTMRNRTLTLMGCTEDITCQNASTHAGSFEDAPYMRTLC